LTGSDTRPSHTRAFPYPRSAYELLPFLYHTRTKSLFAFPPTHSLMFASLKRFSLFRSDSSRSSRKSNHQTQPYPSAQPVVQERDRRDSHLGVVAAAKARLSSSFTTSGGARSTPNVAVPVPSHLARPPLMSASTGSSLSTAEADGLVTPKDVVSPVTHTLGQRPRKPSFDAISPGRARGSSFDLPPGAAPPALAPVDLGAGVPADEFGAMALPEDLAAYAASSSAHGHGYAQDLGASSSSLALGPQEYPHGYMPYEMNTVGGATSSTGAHGAVESRPGAWPVQQVRFLQTSGPSEPMLTI